VRRLLLAVALVLLCGLPAAPRAAGDSGFVATLAPDGPARGVVIGIHGGAWYGVGRELSMTVRDDLERWRRQGWHGVIVDYPKGGAAPASLLRAYDKVRARYPGLPVCLYGESAGGHLALLVAATRPDVACVETAGAPTDLEAIDPSLSPRAAHADRNARMAFPSLRAAGPVHLPIRARLLVTHLRTDPVIGVAHAARMPAERRLVLEPGPIGWVHGGVDASSFAALRRAEASLMAAVAPANVNGEH
jgi:alpha-beta hydrolase superfamily lysophospholipase